MKSRVYRSSKNSFVRLIIPQDTDLSSVPGEVLSDLGTLSPEKDIDIDTDRIVIGLADVMRDIRKKGYYVGPFQSETFTA